MGTVVQLPEAFTAWPRSAEERFRISVLRNDEPCWIASCGSPEALGLALVTLANEGEFHDEIVGVFDTQPDGGQYWIINPFVGRRKA